VSGLAEQRVTQAYADGEVRLYSPIVLAVKLPLLCTNVRRDVLGGLRKGRGVPQQEVCKRLLVLRGGSGETRGSEGERSGVGRSQVLGLLVMVIGKPGLDGVAAPDLGYVVKDVVVAIVVTVWTKTGDRRAGGKG